MEPPEYGMRRWYLELGLILGLAWRAAAQVDRIFEGFENHGLVGVGRISASAFDRTGNGRQDSLGGFSAMAVDPSSLRYSSNQITGQLIGLPDRGFGDGSTDYRPRLEFFDFSFTPAIGTGPFPQNQLRLTNSATRMFTYRERGRWIPFTGLDADDSGQTRVPRARPDSPAAGRRSLDPEGLVILPGSGYWVADEYGPALYRFDRRARLQETLWPPDSFLPRIDGRVQFTAQKPPESGRRNNRGFEGLTLTPDRRRLVAFLQSPLMQDAGGSNRSQNTRMLEFDIAPRSPTRGQVVGDYVYPLTWHGSPNQDRHTPVSEVLALTDTTFLALERDGFGRGSPTNGSPAYKQIVLFTTQGATNWARSPKGVPPEFPERALSEAEGAMRRREFIDLTDSRQLARFGLNTKAQPDENTLSEKWEALTLVPLRDPTRPRDFLLWVGNDHDFKAPQVWHNGQIVATNAVAVDLMILVYRVTLPGVQ